MRPDQLVLVTGTGTGVGKTWVGASLLRSLRETGVAVSARKPVQSFAPDEGPTDAEVLAEATGELAEYVCPPNRWYPLPLAPPIAAAALGRPAPSVSELAAEITWRSGTAVGLVEGVGGPCSPLASDGDSVALAALLAPDLVVLVAPAGLGAINAVRLAAAALADHRLVVVLNRFEPAIHTHVANRQWLADRDGFEVTVDLAELTTRLAGGGARRG